MPSLDPALAAQTVVYKAGGDDEADPLLNPAHLLVGTRAPNPAMAEAFAAWLVGPGQTVVAGFQKNGERLYTPAPTTPAPARRRIRRWE